MVRAGAVLVQTLGGLRSVEYRAGPGAGQGYGRVDMGRAVLGSDIDAGELGDARWGQHVDMGNPHVVLFGLQAADDTVRRVGPHWEGSIVGGANVEFVWPGPGAGELSLRVWERGVGETLACGTGACAVVAAAHAHGEAGARVRVHNPGGPLDVELGDAGVFLGGPAQKVGDVTVDEAVLASMVTRADTIDATGPDVGDGPVTGSGDTPRVVVTEVATRQ
jgi:diaminopimelate epimerase